MINYHKGNLLEEVTNGIICHGCNCQATMGAGFALQVAKKYREVDWIYETLIGKGDYRGLAHLIPVSPKLYICNCYTQLWYGRNKKHFEDWAFDICMAQVMRYSQRLELPVHMPKIGCNLGGADWVKEVEPIVQKYAAKVEINVWELK